MVQWRLAPMTGGARHGPRWLYSLAWSAQYRTSRPPAHTEPRAPMRSRKAAPFFGQSFCARPTQQSQGPTLTPGPTIPRQLLLLLSKFALRTYVTIVQYCFRGRGSAGRANLGGSRGAVALPTYLRIATFVPFIRLIRA